MKKSKKLACTHNFYTMKKIFLTNIFALLLWGINLSAQCSIQVLIQDVGTETCIGSSDGHLE